MNACRLFMHLSCILIIHEIFMHVNVYMWLCMDFHGHGYASLVG